MEKITVIGGDLRNVKLVESLAKDNIKIDTFGLEQAEGLKKIQHVIMHKNLQEAIKNNPVVISSIPFSSNQLDVNAPFSSQKIEIEELGKLLNKQNLVIAGSLKPAMTEKLNKNGAKVIDILEREELAVYNAISTAEGAIQVAIENTLTTLHDSKILILGFGRIGRVLAKMLQGIGAQVYCEARKNADLAWIKTYGYIPVSLYQLEQELSEYDIIINTIPVEILDENKLGKIRKDTLIIDLASKPGGVNREVAANLGIKVIWALSLPGKVAPVTSAEFIKQTIYNILKEEQFL